MTVYRIEMRQNGNWRIAKAPFGGLLGNRTTKDQAVKDMQMLKLKWESNLLFKERYPDQIPTDWRIMEREETDWTESK